MGSASSQFASNATANLLYSRSRYNPSADIPDLTGKVALVTGANAGIGHWTCFHLRKHGAKVYLAVRNEGRGRDGIAEMDSLLDPEKNVVGSAELLIMDLQDPRTVQKAARDFLEKEPGRVDILVNNAAAQATGSGERNDGISRHMVVNHISHFVLVKTLEPLLKKTALAEGSNVRIVTLSSDSHVMATGPEVKFDSIESFNVQPKFFIHTKFFDSIKPYALSKLANVLMAKELQRRYTQTNIPIISIVVHPGTVRTKYAEKNLLNVQDPWFPTRLYLKLCISSEKGAYTSLFAATSPRIRKDPETYGGAYLVPFGKVKRSSPLTYSQSWQRICGQPAR